MNKLGFQILNRSQYLGMPWKNGLGETLEIHRVEDDQGLRFRISQASVVASGHFSNFASLQRTLVLLGEGEMTLTHDMNGVQTQNHLIKSLDIATFDGAALTSAMLLQGPIEDLNIMVREQDTRAKVTAYWSPCEMIFKPSAEVLFRAFYASEPCGIELQATAKKSITVALAKNSILILQHAEAVLLTQGAGVLIEVVLA